MEQKITKEEKCRMTQKGRIVIHKGHIEKRIYPDQWPAHQQKGWEKGPSEKHRASTSAAHKGQESWSKGIKGVMKGSSSTWHKGHEPWNKNKNPSTLMAETLQDELSQYYMNECNSLDACAKHFGLKIYEVYTVLKAKGVVRSKYQASANRNAETLRIKASKDYLTRKKNNTFNSSRPEEALYEELLTTYKHKTIYRQYKDARYPFYCDFYIKEDDLFIELNNHWTHGGHPYDPENLEDQQKLKMWAEKAKTSKFYKNAIEVWTVRDVAKQRIAKENKLNYRVIY